MAKDINDDTAVQLAQSPEAFKLKKLSGLLIPEICVICLDRLSEKTIALPCQHDHFDFACLGTWLQQHRECPLCKQEVFALKYDLDGSDTKIFHLPINDLPHSVDDGIRTRRLQDYRQARNFRNQHPRSDESHPKDSGNIMFRRRVYKHQLYSLHVGSNQISRYRNITPASFLKDEPLAHRARIWIRRELQVFDFLNPNSSAFGNTDRRASNAEFLLEYIVAILKSIDLKGSSGQAENLLKDFLGRQNARLFLHELEAWLRSPYQRLSDWDMAVQYAEEPTV